MAYAARRPRGLDLALSILSIGHATDSYAAIDAVIQSRGVVLDELAARARSAGGSDPELASLSASVTAARERFANLMLRSLQGEDSVPRAVLDEARQQKEEAERSLAERSAAVRSELARARVGRDEVRRALPAGSALVSFVRYDRTSFTTIGSRTMAHATPSYVAFVMLPDSNALDAIALGPAASLEPIVAAWREEAGGRCLPPACRPLRRSARTARSARASGSVFGIRSPHASAAPRRCSSSRTARSTSSAWLRCRLPATDT